MYMRVDVYMYECLCARVKKTTTTECGVTQCYQTSHVCFYLVSFLSKQFEEKEWNTNTQEDGIHDK